jgi:hypothetical protein
MPTGVPLELRGAELVSRLVEALVQSRTRSREAIDKILPRGRFFFHRDEKFFLKGVNYGPFAPSRAGVPFPEEAIVNRDFSLMAQSGVNCFRTFTLPPKWLLDLANSYGLRAIIGIPWAQHTYPISTRIELKRKSATPSPAALRHAKTIPPSSLISSGTKSRPKSSAGTAARKFALFLAIWWIAQKTSIRGAFVSYANFPSTEYLETEFPNFLAFNVYLHHAEDFRHYLSHLHNLAGDRPLVLTEVGIDSIRQGTVFQVEALAWQLRACFQTGVAGTVIFSCTDDGYAFQPS